MGCISSKILKKSLSFREDLSHSHRSKRNRIATSGIPDDLLFTSGNGNGNGTSGDHKFLSKKSQVPKSALALEPTNVEMINTWELMAGLEEQEVETASSKIVDADKIRRRSKSFHWSPEDEGSIIDHVFDVGKKGVGRSRSFHTVEEYDAMLERILLSKAQKNDDDDDDYVQLKPCGASSTMNYQYTQNKNGIQLLSRGKDLVEDNAMDLTSGPDDIKQVFPRNTITITIEESSSFKDVVIQERSIKTKGLESLQIPSAVELQSIGSLREWLLGGGGGGGDGCVESPGDYVTPKFGNYDKSCGEEWKEEPILNPELLAAFEEFIQQLEIEEERFL